MLLLLASLMFSAFFYGHSVVHPIKIFSTVIALFFLVDHCARKGSIPILLKAMSDLLILWLLIHSLTLVLFPDGFVSQEMMLASGGTEISTNYWFLGWPKRIAYYAMPALMASISYSYMAYHRIASIRTFTAIVLFLFPAIKSWAAGALAILCIFFLLLLFWTRPFFRRMMKPYTLLAIAWLWWFCIVVFRLQKYFSFIIVDVLHKDLTFTGRTILWDLALERFSSSPIIGTGFFMESTPEHLYRLFSGFAPNAHSLPLDLMVGGGLISIIIYLWLQLHARKKISPFTGSTLNSAIIMLSAFVLIFNTQTDPLYAPSVFVPLIFAEHIGTIINIKRPGKYQDFGLANKI
jgi:O-antigen ligase